jgi:lysyl-tRNA synthetase class 2
MGVFMERANRHAWVPGVVACSEEGARLWSRTVGLEALEIGDEAVVPTEQFSLDGRDKRNLRQAVKRLERAGFTTLIRASADIPAAERAEIDRLSASWRNGSVERGYSMALGRVCADEDPDCLVVTVEHAGQLCGILQFVPWGLDGLSLDVMRRDRSTQSGTMDLAISALLAAGPGLGVQRVSLNFAPFRAGLENGARIGAGPMSRIWRGVLLTASRLTQIESIYRFNEKFRPDWEPRFIMYPTSRDLVRVSLAYLRIESFVPRPRWFTPEPLAEEPTTIDNLDERTS